MLDIQKSIITRFPKIESLPVSLSNGVFNTIRKVIHEPDINEILQEYKDYSPCSFIDSVLDRFNFSYKYSSDQIENIPSAGRAIVIANHPLGAFDALSLIHLLMKHRKDIRVLANDFLNKIKPLEPILIPVNTFGNQLTRESVRTINKSLDDEQLLLIFPAGEVSRIRPSGVKDGKWNKGFLKIAQSRSAPILPVKIIAKNSAMFYTVSTLNKKVSTILLPSETFKQKNKFLEFKIGEMIPVSSFPSENMDIRLRVKLFKKHLYKIGTTKKLVFKTHKRIAHPESRQALKRELSQCEILGTTRDNKIIYLYEPTVKSLIMREIGRLRELTFRKVEEGTGMKRDTDAFDEYYKHIILWDDTDLEIVGSYRIGVTREIFSKKGVDGLYCHRLFEFQNEFLPYLNNALELGRSFVQPKYWGSRSLDYLWQGIGAYLRKYRDIRYLFGAVSLTAAWPEEAKKLLVAYYSKYYGRKYKLVHAIHPFILTKQESNHFDADIQQDFQKLKNTLKGYNLSIPTLFKQYTELCEPGGVTFEDFDIDAQFNNCVDGFILLDLQKMKEKKWKRYIC